MDNLSPPSSMDDSAPLTSMDSDSGSDLDAFRPYVGRGRQQRRGGRGRGRRQGGRGRRLTSRRRGGRAGNRGSDGRRNRSSHLSAAAVTVLNEIGSTVWKREEPQCYAQAYTQTPGPTSTDVTDESTPAELFCHFFSDEVWDLMKVETNRYASTYIDSNPSSRAWSDTTVEELKAFVGLLILMGIVRLPRLELY